MYKHTRTSSMYQAFSFLFHHQHCLYQNEHHKSLPVLITNFFLLCTRQIRLKIYYIMFALTIQTVYLVMMMMMMMMMMMIQVIFQHVMWKLHMMKLLKYAENKSYDTMPPCLIYFLKFDSIYVHFLMLQWKIFQQLSLYAHAQQTYFICR